MIWRDQNFSKAKSFLKATGRHLLALSLALTSFIPLSTIPASAAPGERSLNLYFTQTNERKQITFRRNGRYVQSGLNELNQFLRDWRRNEPTDMDPALFDLIWKVYQDVGATGPITIVSAYRSPATNEMLRSRSRAVAKNSQHTKGSAVDFYIRGVPTAKLREAALRLQVGGVGYYPTAGNPFVHLDTAGVRAWPRLTSAQLRRLFPDGRTLHIPTNGVPISAEGRRYAQAEWDRCRSIPCASSGNTSITAPNGNQTNSRSGRTLLDLFFGNNQQEEAAPVVVANTQTNNNGPVHRTVATVAVTAPAAIPNAPVPAPRAQFLDYRSPQTIPVPLQMPRELFVATRTDLGDSNDIASTIDPITVASIAPANQSTLSNDSDTSSLLIAYAPVIEPEPDAQRALQMLIERRSASLGEPKPGDLQSNVLRGSISTASLSPLPVLSPATPTQTPATQNLDPNNFSSFFDGTFSALENVRAPLGLQNNFAEAILNSSAAALSDNAIPLRNIQFTAPDLEHVADSLVMQTKVANADFAIMFEPDEGDFNPATELGPHTVQIKFTLDENQELFSSRFTRIAPAIIAAI